MMLNSVRWFAPVMVSFLPGAERQFDCVHDALDYLEHEWPISGGRHREHAKRALRAALARQLSAEEAREAFVAACVEAGILGRGYMDVVRNRRTSEPVKTTIAIDAMNVSGEGMARLSG